MIARLLPVTAAAACAAGLALTGCSGSSDPQPSASTSESSPSASATCDPAEVVADWPLEDRIRQLMFAGVWTEDGDPVATATAVATDGIGGINFLGNGAGAYEDGELQQVLDVSGDIAPFLAVDQEGGRVQRLRDVIGSQPSARTMGQIMTPDQVEELARETGDAMTDMRLDMDLAPVLGVSDQPDNTVIGDRAFSDDPQEVIDYAGAYADGLREAGVIPVYKHFPGLGSATGNTDFEPASTPPLKELRRRDLIPYETLLKQSPAAVMMATAVVPGLTDGEQAGLSRAAIDLLREDYGFDGVVMTDSLSGAAVQTDFTLPEAAVRALAAGNDMVLWDTTTEVIDILTGIADAVGDGTLTEEQINKSVMRVLDLKQFDVCG